MSDEPTNDSAALTEAPRTPSSIVDDAINKAMERDFASDPKDKAAKSDETTEQARDEHGKFVAKQESAEKPDAPAEATPAEAQPVADAAPAALQPPARWSDADKAVFQKLPAEAQNAVLQRNAAMEADYTRKTQEVSEQRKTVEPFFQALTPHSQYLDQVGQALGQHPSQLVGSIIGTERTLRTGQPGAKAAIVADLIRSYQVDLGAINRALGQPSTTPVVQAPDPVINDLRQQLSGMEAWRNEQELQAARGRVEQFRSAKDANGQPLYPHFDRVREQMAPLVQGGLDYETAYYAAARPIIDALSAYEQSRPTQAVDPNRAAAVARAKQASSPKVNGSVPGGSAAKTPSQIVAESMAKVGLN